MRGAIGMGAHCSKTDPRALSKRRRSAAVGVCRVSEGPVQPDLPFFKAARNPGFSTVNSLTKHGLSTVQFTSTGWIRWALHESETACPPGLPGPRVGCPTWVPGCWQPTAQAERGFLFFSPSENEPPSPLVSGIIDYNMPLTSTYLKQMKLRVMNSQEQVRHPPSSPHMEAS